MFCVIDKLTKEALFSRIPNRTLAEKQWLTACLSANDFDRFYIAEQTTQAKTAQSIRVR